MNETAGTPLPMNSTPTHPKLKLSLSFSDKTFIAGDYVCGALEMSSHGGGAGERGKELGIGSMMVEMWGVEGVCALVLSCSASTQRSSQSCFPATIPPKRLSSTADVCSRAQGSLRPMQSTRIHYPICSHCPRTTISRRRVNPASISACLCHRHRRPRSCSPMLPACGTRFGPACRSSGRERRRLSLHPRKSI